jgi:hypothetical protein
MTKYDCTVQYDEEIVSLWISEVIPNLIHLRIHSGGENKRNTGDCPYSVGFRAQMGRSLLEQCCGLEPVSPEFVIEVPGQRHQHPQANFTAHATSGLLKRTELILSREQSRPLKRTWAISQSTQV